MDYQLFRKDDKNIIAWMRRSSKMVYEATIYAKVVYSERNGIHLIIIKSRIATVQSRDALLLLDLMQKVNRSLKMKRIAKFCWINLLVAAEKWKQFVRFRVATIQESVSREQCRYVKSKNNPANLNSHGYDVQIWLDSTLWWSSKYIDRFSMGEVGEMDAIEDAELEVSMKEVEETEGHVSATLS